jgi:hypothetical protein
MQGPSKMTNEANELIDTVEKYEEANIHEDEEDFNQWNPDQQILEEIMINFINEHGVGRYQESGVLDALPTVLLSRDVSHWTYYTIARFCDQYDGIMFPHGYFGQPLDDEFQGLMDLKVKLQRCAKRFVARNRLASTKIHTEETCAICMGPLNPRYNKHTPCGHLFHTGCIRRWKLHKSNCPMCRNDLE